MLLTYLLLTTYELLITTYLPPPTQGAAERERSRLRAVVEEAAERSPGATVAYSQGDVLYEQGDAADKVFLADSYLYRYYILLTTHYSLLTTHY